MERIDLENGAYKLIADEGKQLVLVDEEGNESFSQEVIVPSGVIFNEWGEVFKTKTIIKEPTEEELKQQRIAQLEAELLSLKSE